MTQELADSINLLRKFDNSRALQTINQLVELVAEMRQYTDHTYHCPANHCFVNECTCKLHNIETKADALLEGLKE